MAGPWNLGPPVMDFSAIGNLGNQFFNGLDRGKKMAAEAERKRLVDEAMLANGGKMPGLQDLAAIAFRTGNTGEALNALGLAGQTDLRNAQTEIARAELQLKQRQMKQSEDTARATMGLFGGGAPQPSGASGDVPSSLIQNESGGRWDAQNASVGAGGKVGHFGRLQFGQARLEEAKAAGAIPADMTPQQFLQNPAAQQAAERWHFTDIDNFIRQKGFDRAVGQNFNGSPVTMDGMRAVAHLGGKGGLEKFLTSGGQYNPADDNGTRLSDYFARHGGKPPAQQQPMPQQGAQSPMTVGSDASSAMPVQAQQPASTRDGPLARLSDPDLMRYAAMPGQDPAIRALISNEISTRRQMAAEDRRNQQMIAAENRRQQAQIEAENRRTQAQLDAEGRRALGQAPTTKQIKQPDGSEASVQWDRKTESWVPLKAPEGGAAVTAPQKLTEAQSKDVGFYNRAAKILPRLEAQDEALTSRLSAAGAQVPLVGNSLKSDAYRNAEQTGRELLAVILRKDTGAAVTDQEMTLYGDMYLPKPGDDDRTIQQKREGRRTAIEGIRMGLGTAEILFRTREAMQNGGGTPQAPHGGNAPQRQRLRFDADGNLAQ